MPLLICEDRRAGSGGPENRRGDVGGVVKDCPTAEVAGPGDGERAIGPKGVHDNRGRVEEESARGRWAERAFDTGGVDGAYLRVERLAKGARNSYLGCPAHYRINDIRTAR